MNASCIQAMPYQTSMRLANINKFHRKSVGIRISDLDPELQLSCSC